MRTPKTLEEHAWMQTKPRPSRAKLSEHMQGAPKMPGYLSKAARKEWKRVLPLLMHRKSVTEADTTVLALYAEAVSRYQGALAEIAKHGQVMKVTVLDSNGAPHDSYKPNPAMKTLEAAERTIRAYLRELGLTPATRERVKPAKPREEDDDDGSPSLLEMMRQEREEL